MNGIKNLRNIDTILFDAGDTLLCPEKGTEACVVEFCQQHGYPVTLDQVIEGYRCFFHENSEYFYTHQEIYKSEQNKYWHIADKGMLMYLGIEESQAEYLAQLLFSEVFTSEKLNWNVFADVVPALDILKSKNLKLGIVSNWGPDLENILVNSGIRNYFGTVMVSGIVGFAKPDPRIFQMALQALDTTPEKTLHVGDSNLFDIAGTVNAGITPLLLDRKQIRADNGCIKITSLSELPVLLNFY